MAEIGRPDDDAPEQASDNASGDGARVAARSLYRHKLAAVGGAFIVGGTIVFALMVFFDLTSPADELEKQKYEGSFFRYDA